jgi:hypothetical protein
MHHAPWKILHQSTKQHGVTLQKTIVLLDSVVRRSILTSKKKFINTLGTCRKIAEKLLVLSRDCVSGYTEQIGYDWTNFYKIWYWSVSRISIEKIEVSLIFWHRSFTFKF